MFYGRHLSNSIIREVYEVNVKFLATRLKRWKKILSKICSKCYSLLYITHGMSKKVKTNHDRSCQWIYFILKTDYLHSKTSYKDESACLWQQLKWDKMPFYGARFYGKIIHGDSQRRQRVWENYLRGTKSPDKATGCPEKLLWTNDWKTK